MDLNFSELSQGDAQMGMISFLVVGILAGWLAGILVKGGGFGLIGDLGMGVLGAFIGGYLFNALGIAPGSGMIGSIVMATIGAVVLLFVVRLLTRET